ncbi:MAG: response regulator transcription factor [Bacteroidales bacterium]|nr:response regulator transcription factor [Bacteroidales bacterium]
MKQYRIDVNIADDHIMVCEGLAEAINHYEDFHVSRKFSTLEACRKSIQENRPDVLLLDISMPDGDGVDFCKEVIAQYPKMKVIAVTIHDEYSVINRLLNVGVHGYLLKTSSVEQLTEAIRRVWQGERYVSPEVENIIAQSQERVVSLTEVERKILLMICDGLTNPQIAKNLHLSTETINWYRKRLLAKFGVKNAVALATLVQRERIL